MLARYFLIFVVLSACVASSTSTSRMELLNHEIELYPSFFYRHHHSKDVLTFEDSSLFIRATFKPPGGGVRITDKDFLSNWSFINDSLIELSNISNKKKSALRNLTKRYYLDKSLKEIDLLIPDNSIDVYQDSLKFELIQNIRDNPFIPDEDVLELMKTDTSALTKLTDYHYESIVSSFVMDHYELGFYFGEW